MQIVIDISEDNYKLIQDGNYCGILSHEIYNAIKYGTPLPKGHGGLIDVNRAKVVARETKTDEDERIIRRFLNTLSPIIEADKAESEE